MGTAYLTVAVLIVYYFLAYEPKSDHFEAAKPNGTRISQKGDFKTNPLDAMLLKFLRFGKSLNSVKQKRLEKSLSNVRQTPIKAFTSAD